MFRLLLTIIIGSSLMHLWFFWFLHRLGQTHPGDTRCISVFYKIFEV